MSSIKITSSIAGSGEFGRRLPSNQKTWTLDCKIGVTGHFRWQPVGPKRSKRKLIWIDEHTRGEGQFLEKIRIETLESVPS